jgi:pimeloyl-ACP methyl ester carboxylesterase
VLEARSCGASIAGHNVFTSTLTGLGERSHLNSAAVDLSTHIADIVNLIKREELSDVVLCGHSYAGAVIAGAADEIPDRIRALVFLDAFVLENGESFMDGLTHNALRRQWLPLKNASSSQAILNTSMILLMCFQQNASQIF